MENRINIAELLKDCPKGMELDCMIWDNVAFSHIQDDETYPIVILIGNDKDVLTKYGAWSEKAEAKCVIFPKGKTTWEGFQRPFKDGDIIFTHTDCLKNGLCCTSIFQEYRNGGIATYVDCAEDGHYYHDNTDGDKCLFCMETDILHQRLATEEEKEKLFKVIKDNGYKWNPETRTLEKLVESKFKIGDRLVWVRDRGQSQDYYIKSIKEDRYILSDGCYLLFKDQDEYELSPNSPNKFDITTLKPFESKVLVRGKDWGIWFPAFWGKYIENPYPYMTTRGTYRICIPYEGNEHLLGTTDDCDEYYKTWE